MHRKPTILLAGGGTAGHVNPLLATADKLKERGYNVLIIGTREGKEAELVPAAGYRLHEIERAPFPRSLGRDFWAFPSRYARAKAQVKRLMLGHHVALVVGFGGYVCPPAFTVARKLGLPVVIHEQNARPGLANKLGAGWARAVALTFNSTPLRAKRGRTEVVGLPLRAQIQQLVDDFASEQGRLRRRFEAAQGLGLDPLAPTLLVSGGSLGAQKINDSLQEALEYLPAGAQILHLTGVGKADKLRQRVDELGLSKRVKVHEYAYDMAAALAVADLAVGRSGAGTVAEQSALGLPSIYVPFPIGNGEQKLNAGSAVEAGAALLCLNEDFTPDYVKNTVFALLANEKKLERMRERARRLEAKNGTENLVRLIEQEVK